MVIAASNRAGHEGRRSPFWGLRGEGQLEGQRVGVAASLTLMPMGARAAKTPGDGKVGGERAAVAGYRCAKLGSHGVGGRVGVGAALSLCTCGSQCVSVRVWSLCVEGLCVPQYDNIRGGSHTLQGPGWHVIRPSSLVQPRVAWRVPGPAHHGHIFRQAHRANCYVKSHCF